jgi:hypothetical protein
MPQPPDRIAGALLVGAACLCWSSGGILVRLLDLDVIVFWRSLFMAVACWSFIEARGSLSSLPSDGPGCYPAFCLEPIPVGHCAK